MPKISHLILIIILILAASFRLYDLNWDQGFHLHPDERWITMVSEKLQLPSSFQEFLSPQSSLNPQSFAYGSLPFYLLKLTGNIFSLINRSLVFYGSLNQVGRLLSVVFDLGTLLLIFLIGQKVFDSKRGLLAAFLYSLAVFPIQNAHFYTVDTQLTFWLTLLVFLLTLLSSTSVKRVQKTLTVGIGIVLGIALATKITALLALPAIVFVLLKNKNPKEIFSNLFLIFFVSLLTFVVLEPYAIIDYSNFKRQTLEQLQMAKNPFAFPYTLQFVGTTPFWYFVKNLILWGLGPLFSFFAFLGITQLFFKKRVPVFLFFSLTFFLLIGGSSVKFMRYILPLYPFLCLLAAVATFNLWRWQKERPILNLCGKLFVLFVFSYQIIYLTAFLQIYNVPNTRVQASDWINRNIPENATLATEHWDDELPLYRNKPFTILKLNLYDSDTSGKISQALETLNKSDYLIIASQRLFIPLQKLGQQYPWTSHYYQVLFTGNLGFKEVVSFPNQPHLTIFGIKLNFDDSSADESFSVYDHPPIIIFQKQKDATIDL